MSDTIIGASTNDLEADGLLSDGPQRISDAAGTESALYIGKTFVGVNTPKADHAAMVLGVQTAVDYGAMFGLTNSGGPTNGAQGEAAIRFSNLQGPRWWHVGMGGGAGTGNFFVWGDSSKKTLFIEPTGNATFVYGVTVAGTLTAANLTVQGTLTAPSVNVSALHGIPASSTAPAGTQLAALAVDPATGKLYALGPQVP
jgi:hypothetical protein